MTATSSSQHVRRVLPFLLALLLLPPFTLVLEILARDQSLPLPFVNVSAFGAAAWWLALMMSFRRIREVLGMGGRSRPIPSYSDGESAPERLLRQLLRQVTSNFGWVAEEEAR